MIDHTALHCTAREVRRVELEPKKQKRGLRKHKVPDVVRTRDLEIAAMRILQSLALPLSYRNIQLASVSKRNLEWILVGQFYIGEFSEGGIIVEKYVR